MLAVDVSARVSLKDRRCTTCENYCVLRLNTDSLKAFAAPGYTRGLVKIKIKKSKDKTQTQSDWKIAR